MSCFDADSSCSQLQTFSYLRVHPWQLFLFNAPSVSGQFTDNCAIKPSARGVPIYFPGPWHENWNMQEDCGPHEPAKHVYQGRRSLKICLIRPPVLVPRSNLTEMFTPPPGLAYVAGSLRADGQGVTFIDALGLDLDRRSPAENDCDLLGMPIDQVVAAIPQEARMIWRLRSILLRMAYMPAADRPYPREVSRRISLRRWRTRYGGAA